MDARVPNRNILGVRASNLFSVLAIARNCVVNNDVKAGRTALTPINTRFLAHTIVQSVWRHWRNVRCLCRHISAQTTQAFFMDKRLMKPKNLRPTTVQQCTNAQLHGNRLHTSFSLLPACSMTVGAGDFLFHESMM